MAVSTGQSLHRLRRGLKWQTDLLINAKNTMDRIYEWWRNLKKNRNNEEIYSYNQKEVDKVLGHIRRNKQDMMNTHRICWKQENRSGGEWVKDEWVTEQRRKKNGKVSKVSWSNKRQQVVDSKECLHPERLDT